jgi:hypothetical protein
MLRPKYEISITFHQSLREINHFEDPDVDGRIILRWIFRKFDEGMDWIDLAQDRDR